MLTVFYKKLCLFSTLIIFSPPTIARTY